jgi:protein-S-isoprenylcysteine O-methyltransferase Ste14
MAAIPRHSVSDWIGFFCFSALALLTVSKMSAVGLLMTPTLALEGFAALSFLIRDSPRAALRGLRTRLAAYGGTFLLLVFFEAGRRYAPEWLTPGDPTPLRAAGAVLWIIGSAWSAYSLWYLRHAFSIEPEARRLVTGGPYATARHPIYAGYLAQYAGMWLLYPTLPLAIVLLIWFVLVAERIRHEERILGAVFSEYAGYRRLVGALVTLRRPHSCS